MTPFEILNDAKKAIAVGLVAVGGAVTAGVIDNTQAAEITGVAGAVSTVLAYLLRNVKPGESLREVLSAEETAALDALEARQPLG